MLAQQLPGDPAFIAAGGGDATPEMIAHARERLGLDRPVWVRYLYYMRNALQGDFGRSRSEEHTSELQSQSNLVCRLLLEKKKKDRRTKALPPSRRYIPTTNL